MDVYNYLNCLEYAIIEKGEKIPCYFLVLDLSNLNK